MRETRMVKIYLDDERKTPDGWLRTMNVQDTITMLRHYEGKVEKLSLDHDLGTNDYTGELLETGYKVLLWIEEEQALNGYVPPKYIKAHTSNPSAKLKMNLAIEVITRKTK